MSNGFFESRTAWGKLKEWLFLEPLLGGSRWAAAFGSLLLFSFLVQVFTGILLSMNYAPSVDSAWPSVNYIMSEVRFGSLVRSMHHWGSSAMVILLLVHLIQVFVWGAYKKPREFTWMVGVLLLMLTLGLAFTGYLLPWDQKAYWATKVGLGIASTVPGIGEWIKATLQGGPQMGNLTLTRFFALHVFILPGLLVTLVVVHLHLFRVHGVTPPWWESESQLEAEKEPFWPGQAFKDAVFALAFLVALVAWAHWWSAPLEAKADPSQPYEARPEWYFMFLFYLLQFFKGPYEVLSTFVLPMLFFLVLFFWPFIDRNPLRRPRRRPVAIGLLSAGSCALVGLTIFAIATDVRMKEPQVVLAKAPVNPPAGPLQQMDVAGLFSINCVACHGVDGTGDQVRPGMPTIPDFTSLSWQLGHTDLHLTQGILAGNPPQMPSFRDKLRTEEAAALAIYLRAFATPAHPEVAPTTGGAPPESVAAAPPSQPPGTVTETPPAGVSEIPTQPPPVATTTLQPFARAPIQPAELYTTFCLACHDRDGRGSLVRAAMPRIPDFTDKTWQQRITDGAAARAILDGKGELMRPFKDKLSEAEALALAGYMREFSSAAPTAVASLPPPAAAQVPPATQPPTTEPTPAAAPPAAQPAPHEKVAAFTPPPVSTTTADASERITQAATQFRQYCLVCHGTDGHGTAVRAGMPTIPDFTDTTWQSSRTNARLAVSILAGSGKLMPPFSDRLSRVQAQALAAYVRAFGPQTKPAEELIEAGDLDARMLQLQDQWRELERQIRSLPQ